jgi:hypothetical protein
MPRDPIAGSSMFPGVLVQSKGICVNPKEFQGPGRKSESQIVYVFFWFL